MRLRFALFLTTLLASACHSPATVVCADGRICRNGMLCDDLHGSCVTPIQLESCDGVPQGDPCMLDVGEGVCDLGVCLDSLCGDGLLGIGEACDDGNLIDGDGCNGTCTSTEVCGNGFTDPGEECDCGDGSEGLPQGCDLPNSENPGAACRTTCIAHCGDGELNELEDCEGVARIDCLDLGFDSGLVSCPACKYDVADCDDIGWRKTAIGASFFSLERVWLREDGSLHAIVGGLLGYGGTIQRLENGQWSIERNLPARPRDMDGVSDDDLHVVGHEGMVVHFDGTVWSEIDVGRPSCNFSSVTAHAGQLFIGGDCGVHRWDGSELHDEYFPEGITTYSALVSRGGDIFALASGLPCFSIIGCTNYLQRRDSEGIWSQTPEPFANPLSLFSTGATLYVTGTGGQLAQLAGEEWTDLAPPTDEAITSAWADNTGLFLGLRGSILRFIDGQWQRHHVATDTAIFTLTRRGSRIIATTVYDGLYDYNLGKVWSTALPLRDGPDPVAATRLNHTAVSPDGEHFVGSTNGLFTLGEHTLQRVAPGDGRLYAPRWFSSKTEGYLLSAPNSIFPTFDRLDVFDGDSLAPFDPPPPTSSYNAVAGSDTELAVSMQKGAVALFEWGGDSWTEVATPNDQPLNGIVYFQGALWGAIAATATTLYVLEDTTWTEVRTVDAPGASMIVIDDTLYLSTLDGLVHKFDGITWSEHDAGSPHVARQGLAAVAITTEQDTKLLVEQGDSWIPYRMNHISVGAAAGGRGILSTDGSSVYRLYE